MAGGVRSSTSVAYVAASFYSWIEELPPTDPASFDTLAWLIAFVISQYISHIRVVAKAFVEEIRKVEESLEPDQHPSLSTLLRKLNGISHRVRISSLGEQITFCVETAEWIRDTVKLSNFFGLSDPLAEARELEQYHPDRLKESIAEVRQHIYDIAAEEEQARNEHRQQREDPRAEREEDFLEKSIKIAEVTKRDSRTMRGIACVTIAFLPATFVSSFFGMNFFNGIAGNIPFDEASRNVYLFFLIALPISGTLLFTFYYWDERQRKRDEQMENEDEEKKQKANEMKNEDARKRQVTSEKKTQ